MSIIPKKQVSNNTITTMGDEVSFNIFRFFWSKGPGWIERSVPQMCHSYMRFMFVFGTLHFITTSTATYEHKFDNIFLHMIK